MHHAARLLAALLALAVALLGSPAYADVAPAPAVLRIAGHPGSVAGAASPDRATFALTNLDANPVDVFLFRAVVRDGGTNIPMEITQAEVDGRSVGHDITVPANAQLLVTVFFDLPSSLRDRSQWSVDLRITMSGHGGFAAEPATLSRARRQPRKLTARASEPSR